MSSGTTFFLILQFQTVCILTWTVSRVSRALGDVSTCSALATLEARTLHSFLPSAADTLQAGLFDQWQSFLQFDINKTSIGICILVFLQPRNTAPIITREDLM